MTTLTPVRPIGRNRHSAAISEMQAMSETREMLTQTAADRIDHDEEREEAVDQRFGEHGGSIIALLVASHRGSASISESAHGAPTIREITPPCRRKLW